MVGLPAMRIFTASFGTETNTFTPVPTNRKSFEDCVYYPAGTHPEAATLLSAPTPVLRRRAQEEGFVLLEGLTAFCNPSNKINRRDYEGFRDTILDEVTAALPLDAVVMGLHGASVAHGYDDVEGDMLSCIRTIVGPDATIAIEIDPHSHLTQLRTDACDLIVGYKEFPHVDQAERAEELVELTLRTLRGEIRPVMRKFDCRLMEVFPTSREPMRSFVDRIMALEQHSELSSLSKLQKHEGGEPGVLSISCVHGFIAADVPEMGAQMLVVTDGEPERAAELAEQLGMELFELRGLTRPDYLTIDDAIDAALQEEAEGVGGAGEARGPATGPAVVADVWDNAGGGAAGDSTFFLQRLIDRNIAGCALGGLWDPVAVEFCHQAGAGTELQLRFGGKTGVASGPPIDALVEILGVGTTATQPFGGAEVALGDTALLAVPVEGGHIEVLLWTERKSRRLDLTTIARLLFQKLLIRQLCPQALRYSIRRPSLPWAATRWRSGWWWSRARTTSSAGSATLRAACTTSTLG